MNRRRFLRSAGVAGLALAAGAHTALNTTTEAVELLTYDIPIDELPPEFEGYTIGLVADTHLGHFVSTEFIAHAVDLLIDAHCDLLVLGGDYIWHPDEGKIWPKTNGDFRGLPHSDVPRAVFARLAQIVSRRAPADGIVAVLGNHDGWIDPTACQREFTQRGIVVLENRRHTIERGSATLQLAGVADLWTGFPELPPLPPQTGRNTNVLVSHNPDFVAEQFTRSTPEFDLALCGHTHGGQIRLPFGGVIFDNIDDKRFVSGLTTVGRTNVYTTKGLGVVEIPLRVNCRPDVTRLTLRGRTITPPRSPAEHR